MKLVKISCPNCGGELKANPQKDSIVCGYCHTEFKVDDEIKRVEINKTIHHIYTDTAKVQEIEMKKKQKEDEKAESREVSIVVFLVIFMIIGLCVFMHFHFRNEEDKSINQENQLQQIVEEVKTKVNQGNYEEAYLKAKEINYTENWSSEIKEKWEKTRKEMIDYVIREEKKATGKSDHKSESSFWDNLFGK